MQQAYQTQTDQPLHPQLLWSRPLNRSSAGRLLIVGGQKGSIAQLQTLYQLATAAGIGECRLAAPDVQSKLLGPTGLAEFLPSSPSGSIGKGAYGQLTYLAEDYDTILIGADLTANSETATVVDKFLASSPARVILTGEALEALHFNLAATLKRPNTLVVTDMAHISKLSKAAKLAAGYNPSIPTKISIVDQLANETKLELAVVGSDIVTATGAHTVVTELPEGHIGQRLPLATALMAVFWTQQPDKTGAALATAAYLTSQTLHSAQDSAKLTVNDLTAALSKRQRQIEDEAFGG